MTIKLSQKLNCCDKEFILLLFSKMDIKNEQMDFIFIKRFSKAFKKLDITEIHETLLDSYIMNPLVFKEERSKIEEEKEE